MIPTGLSYVNGSASNGGTYNSTNGVITWNLSVGANSSGQVTFQATVNSNVAPGAIIADQANISGNGITLQSNAATLVTPYLVTPSAGANGSISPSTPQAANTGGSLTFTATPNSQYAVFQWIDNGSVVQYGGTQYTLSNINANHTISVTFMTLTASPTSPQALGTPVTLTATPHDDPNVEYKFRVGYIDDTGWHWTDLTGYTTSPTYTWTSNDVQTYTLAVWARKIGHANNYDTYASLIYQTPPMSMTASPAAPQLINTPVTLTVSMDSGGHTMEYKYRVGYYDGTGWHWTDLTGYTAATVKCTPLSRQLSA